MECSVNTGEEKSKNVDRSFAPKPPPRPLYLVEQEATDFKKQQTFIEKIWNGSEGRTFALFVDYLRMLRVESYERIDADFFNALRMNLIQTFFEGTISKQNLYAFCSGVDTFIDSKFDSGLTPLFYEEEIYDIIMERKKFARFDADSFHDALEELRENSLYTEVALLEVVRYLGLSLKESMFINPSLSLDYARTHGHIVIRNQDAQYSRRIPVWNEEQSTALIRLATNRLKFDSDENYRHKKFAYVFSPLNPIHKILPNNNLSLYSLRKAYFEDEFYSGAFVDFSPEEISQQAHLVSLQMGHPYCFDDAFLLKRSLDERKIVSAHAIIERHPAKLNLPDPIRDYIQDYRNRPRSE